MIISTSRVVASSDQISCNLGDEKAILHLKNEIYYGLNATAAVVWQMVQAPKTFSEICAAVVEEFDVDPEQCQKDLRSLLEDLHTHGLLEIRV